MCGVVLTRQYTVSVFKSSGYEVCESSLFFMLCMVTLGCADTNDTVLRYASGCACVLRGYSYFLTYCFYIVENYI